MIQRFSPADMGGMSTSSLWSISKVAFATVARAPVRRRPVMLVFSNSSESGTTPLMLAGLKCLKGKLPKHFSPANMGEMNASISRPMGTDFSSSPITEAPAMATPCEASVLHSLVCGRWGFTVTTPFFCCYFGRRRRSFPYTPGDRTGHSTHVSGSRNVKGAATFQLCEHGWYHRLRLPASGHGLFLRRDHGRTSVATPRHVSVLNSLVCGRSGSYC